MTSYELCSPSLSSRNKVKYWLDCLLLANMARCQTLLRLLYTSVPPLLLLTTSKAAKAIAARVRGSIFFPQNMCFHTKHASARYRLKTFRPFFFIIAHFNTFFNRPLKINIFLDRTIYWLLFIYAKHE